MNLEEKKIHHKPNIWFYFILAAFKTKTTLTKPFLIFFNFPPQNIIFFHNNTESVS